MSGAATGPAAAAASASASAPAASSPSHSRSSSTASNPATASNAPSPKPPKSAGTKAPAAKRGGAGQRRGGTPVDATLTPPTPEEGVVLARVRVEIEVEVAPWVAPLYPTKEATAFDQRFEFRFPGVPDPVAAATAAVAAAAAEAAGAETSVPAPAVEEQLILTPPTGVWDLMPAIGADGQAIEATPAGASSAADAATAPAAQTGDPNRRHWSRTMEVRFDRHTLRSWEDRTLHWSLLQRSVTIPAPPAMLRPDGSVMSAEEAAAATAAAQATAEAAAGGGGRTAKRKGSAGAGGPSSGKDSARALEKEAKAREKEREKEKLRRWKEKEKAAKAAGLPPPPPLGEDEEDLWSSKPSRAHPELEAQDRPWVLAQRAGVAVSPALFGPVFSAQRCLAPCPDADPADADADAGTGIDLPPRGLRSYTVRLVIESDPMAEPLRRELNPLLITLSRVSNLSPHPCASFAEMRRTYKPVRAQYEFFASGLSELVPPPPPPAPAAPVPGAKAEGQHEGRHGGRAAAEAAANAAAAAAAAAALVPPVYRPVPAPTAETLAMPHEPTLRFEHRRVVFLGLYDRSALAAAVQTRKLRVLLRDREHRASWTPAARAEEAAKAAAEAEAEARRLEAEAALASKNKKGRKRSAGPGGPGAAGADSARKSAREKKGTDAPAGAADHPSGVSAGAGAGAGDDAEKESPSDSEDAPEPQPESVLSHMTFKATAVDALLSAARDAASRHSVLPPHLGGTAHLRPKAARYNSEQNVYGTAEFGLHDLFRGSTTFALEAPVRPVFPPAHLGLIHPQQRQNPYQPWHHLGAQGQGQGETTVAMHFRLSFPLGTLVHEAPSRYERVFLWFPYGDSILYQKVLAAIARANVLALGLDLAKHGAGSGGSGEEKEKRKRWGGAALPGQGEEDAPAAESNGDDTSELHNTSLALLSLGSLRLTPAQLGDPLPTPAPGSSSSSSSSSLDVLTSVQVLDDVQRIFLIEGLAESAGGRSMPLLRRALGRERGCEDLAGKGKEFFRLLSNPAVTFPTRLYGCFHAVPRNIRLGGKAGAGETLQTLSRRNGLYVVPRGATAETLSALTKMLDLTRTGKLRAAQEASLFPGATELLALEKYLGGAFIGDQDLFGGVPTLTEVDRYDPGKKGVTKAMPDPAQVEGEPPARPRSRGQRRAKLAERSIEQDLARIASEGREGRAKAKRELLEQTALFEALSAEMAAEQGLTAAASTSTQHDLARTLPRQQGHSHSNLAATAPSSPSRSLAADGEDAEVAPEAFTGFRRAANSAGRKAALSTGQPASTSASKARTAHSPNKFIRKNVLATRAASEALAATKSPGDYPRYLQPSELGLQEFHVYGGQKHNAFALQKALMRSQMAEAEARTGTDLHYTYSAEFLSASFAKVDLDEEAQRARKREIEARLTPQGFVWPAHKTHAESFRPRKDLHPATVEALQSPPDLGVEVPRGGGAGTGAGVQHPDRFRAYNAACKEFGAPDNPDWGRSLAQSGSAAATAEVLAAARRAEQQRWKEKMVVDDPAFHVLWVGSGQAGSNHSEEGQNLARKLARLGLAESNGAALAAAAATAASSSSASSGAATGSAGHHHLPALASVPRPSVLPNMLVDPPARPGLKFERVARDPAGKVVGRRGRAVPDLPVSMHSMEPFVDQNRTVHMRTLEEKEAALLQDTPREAKPRFAVSPPTPVHAFVHRRKIPEGPTFNSSTSQ